MTLLAYRFALDPTPRQERASAKDSVAPWWGECSKEAFTTGLDQLTRALKNRADSREGKRKGRPVGFPRFRSKRKARPSIRFTTGAIRCETSHAVLPRLGRIKLQVADQRQDTIHKLTTDLATTYGTLVVEDLHVAGMVANRRPARHVADAGFAQIHRQLEYKTTWHGGTLIVTDRWFASSKTCSQCGAVKATLALGERTSVCEACGAVRDRDVNAAVNLARLAAGGAGKSVN